ncbi:SDR family oxidoreductase [Tsukamurella sp. 1534]|uniref:SDR family oxidoreductase n=1 Tax=Tsukamurella sp. 1534 TaxID=1151061 RepID=UPI0002D6CE30|nr:SDR family oxidoreductase [Tsukamurella sp. 1534]
MSAFDPDGSGVVVTGAAGGIGAALAKALAAKGARVVVADLNADGVAGTVDAITAAGGTAFGVAGDAASEDGVAALVDAAKGHLGAIDAWYGNAGVDRGRGLDAAEGDWDLCWQVNVMAHVRAARLLVPDWVAKGAGRYVVTASAAGLLTMLGAPAYSVTKHGAVAFAEWLSATYRHQGVVVQAICPQGVQTRMLDDSGPLKEVLSHDTALTPEQVADSAIAALAGDEILILPHPEVGDYYKARAAVPDKWLAGMNRIQQQVEAKEGR